MTLANRYNELVMRQRAGEIRRLRVENADMQQRIDALLTERAELKRQVEALTAAVDRLVSLHGT